MAESAGRRARRGPAPIASFDHDVSDESSPETKQTFQLPEIREDASAAGPSLPPPPEARARSQSTPGLGAPPAPRIDISRASSSSHHDSRDSSPELALFAGCDDRAPDHLGFREDGALELRSSTEELAFLEPQPEPAPPAPLPARGAPPPPPPAPAPLSAAGSRRHSRKDSQGSEAALLAISGRTSRLSSIGSQCSAQSALSHGSRVSRLSVVSGVSRSPSPHKMLLETSFCGPKPIEMDPEICAADVEERLLEIAKLQAPPSPPARLAAATLTSAPTPAPEPAPAPAPAPDARDHREVRTEATVEAARPPRPAPAPPAVNVTPPASTDDKREKETRNRQARSRERRDHSEPEVFKGRNRSKDIIRIKLKPSEEYDDDDEDEDIERTLAGVGVGVAAGARKPESLALGGAARPPPTGPGPGPAADRSARSPSPAPQPPSRKSSFCSLFKSRETIASPDSPSEALRRKKSLNEGRSRSKSRDRSAPPSSAGKLRGSVISLFKTPRRGAAASPSPSSRAASPGPAPPPAGVPPPPTMRGLKYYEDTRDGIIHIPLRTPPDEEDGAPVESEPREAVRPASAPCTRPAAPPSKPTQRTVLPDGSIIIPLHSPTEGEPPTDARRQVAAVVESPPRVVPHEREPAPDPEPEPELESEPQLQPERRPSTHLPSDVESPPAAAAPPTPPSPAWPDPAWPDPARSRRKERLVFMTHVGSAEQVFSTQFSITKTPSVASEISESFPSLQEELRPAGPGLRDTHIAADDVETAGCARDSSESEGSSEAGGGGGGGAGRAGGDAEARELVAQQESFEEELPYVPTTLPQERSLALPMLPVRERGMLTHTIARVERPRSGSVRGAGAALPAPPPPPPAAPPPPHPRLRIRLPRRASAAATVTTVATATTVSTAPAAAVTTRTRTRSGSEARAEPRKAEWIDFSEVPERRPAARRIQTLPARAEPAPVSYVEPEHCRCECHRSESPAHSSPEGEESPSAAQPFTADLDVREQPPAAPAARAQPPPTPTARDQPPPAPGS